MKFFLDACMPYSSKEIFQKYGEVTHARDIGMTGATDKEIIQYALKNKAILVTKDLDFGNTLLYPVESHFGVNCFFDCGLCPRHHSHTNLLNIVLTNRRDSSCWYCFFYHKEGQPVYVLTT